MRLSDPRLATSQEDLSVVPVVARPSPGVPLALIVGGAVFAGLLLFGVLESRRQIASAPVTVVPRERSAGSEAVPPLDIPARADDQGLDNPSYYGPESLNSTVAGPRVLVAKPGLPEAPLQLHRSGRTLPAPSIPVNVQTVPAAGLFVPQPASAPPSAIVAPGPPAQPPSALKLSGYATNRVTAHSFEHPSQTVMQGTLIAAVLETGFDSTLPGFARAVVSRNVMSFDGTKLLIPRGSHLIGEYQSDTGAAQKRARIVWTRLVRPDGINIDLDSPSSDPVGRGGVKAHVNSHFMKRFVGALLQTAVNIGSTLTTRSSNTAVVIAGPNAASSVSQFVPPNDLQPTLRVDPGTSVSVFVARDLDFTEVDNP